MTDISRRSLLTIGAATALASTVGSLDSRAMAPLIGKQGYSRSLLNFARRRCCE
jgi:hypothetical protein